MAKCAAYISTHLATQVSIHSVHCTDDADASPFAAAHTRHTHALVPCNIDTNSSSMAHMRHIHAPTPCNTGTTMRTLPPPWLRPNTNPLFTVYTPLPSKDLPMSTLLPHHWQELLAEYP